ncbi:MAG: HAD family hydrolase [Flavobacteriales bacterium]|jgi:D-glycero-D-manno-heptose 1,7-bisphosphate phosphatase|nr:HAD family hydrolase [Flavobacteriales bacterium]
MGRRAIFLDRDGVINRERGTHTWRPEDFEVLPEVPDALRLLQDAGWLLVVVTNQSGIGLGLYGHADVEKLHGYLHAMLKEHGVGLTDILYCPHHPDQGRCLCRKPGALLLERACARHGIDPRASVMIGDRERDVAAARAIGARGLLVEANAPLLAVLDANGLRP